MMINNKLVGATRNPGEQSSWYEEPFNDFLLITWDESYNTPDSDDENGDERIETIATVDGWGGDTMTEGIKRIKRNKTICSNDFEEGCC